MIAVRIQAPYASFRKSYARSFAESYPFAPPATVYGMLLSLVGERSRARHVGVRLAFAYARQPTVATTLRKLSRYKYGVASKQEKLGNAPDFVETLCGLDFLCWIDSSGEVTEAGHGAAFPRLEERVEHAVLSPETVTRSGIVCLGLSDDAVDAVTLVSQPEGTWRWLVPDEAGEVELPTWVDHVGAVHTRWRRFRFDAESKEISRSPSREHFVAIDDPRLGRRG
ncbi:type I-MYXAN CRISPR-associated protein Cas5/Cmx5/DevS [Sorangium sp. So ce1078]|uniref:type I-MYXAN CRISPR-associated protein Cas5/Cmx5/DevS n=1 Tax=Sorangium sp. So ce1078 TaxID=3133329 RepID=UPI003F62B004